MLQGDATGYTSVISGNTKSQADLHGSRINHTMIGNQSLQNINLVNDNSMGYASSTINGMKMDSFYIDQVQNYNVKYNPKA